MYVYGNPLGLTDLDGHRPERTAGGFQERTIVEYIVNVEMLENLNSMPAYRISFYNNLSKQLHNGAKNLGEYLPGPALVFYASAAFEKSAAYIDWAGQVMPRGPWDHKRFIVEDFGFRENVDGQIYTHDTWSNIHYGYIGKALGFTDDELLYGAGSAQLLDEAVGGFSNSEYNAYLLSGNALATYLDNGNDPAFIQFGIYLWDNYHETLTVPTFLEELSTSGLSIGIENENIP